MPCDPVEIDLPQSAAESRQDHFSATIASRVQPVQHSLGTIPADVEVSCHV